VIGQIKRIVTNGEIGITASGDTAVLSGAWPP